MDDMVAKSLCTKVITSSQTQQVHMNNMTTMHKYTSRIDILLEKIGQAYITLRIFFKITIESKSLILNSINCQPKIGKRVK